MERMATIHVLAVFVGGVRWNVKARMASSGIGSEIMELSLRNAEERNKGMINNMFDDKHVEGLLWTA